MTVALDTTQAVGGGAQVFTPGLLDQGQRHGGLASQPASSGTWALNALTGHHGAARRVLPRSSPILTDMSDATEAVQEAARDESYPSPRFEMKSHPEFFRAIISGAKLHDLRETDRSFVVGDILRLREFDSGSGAYTGRCVDVEVTYITSPDSPCYLSGDALRPGYCILSIRLVPTREAAQPDSAA